MRLHEPCASLKHQQSTLMLKLQLTVPSIIPLMAKFLPYDLEQLTQSVNFIIIYNSVDK